MIAGFVNVKHKWHTTYRWASKRLSFRSTGDFKNWANGTFVPGCVVSLETGCENANGEIIEVVVEK